MTDHTVMDNSTCVEEFIDALETAQQRLEMCRDNFDINENRTREALDAKGHMEKICKVFQALLDRYEFEIEELREGLESSEGFWAAG
jgi:hypothetical protein